MRARMAAGRCFIEWMAGDLQVIPEGATHTAVSETHNLRESLGWAHYFLASVAYQRDDLTAAEAHARGLEKIRYLGRPLTYLHGAFIYASIYQARGLPEQARQKLDQAFDFIRETRSEGLLPLAEGFQAELALMRGDLGAANRWATTIGPMCRSRRCRTSTRRNWRCRNPAGAGHACRREQAAEALSRLHAFVTATHNTRFTIEVLALEALLYHAQGDEQGALGALEQAVILAQPGGFVRVFADLGPNMADLFGRLAAKDLRAS